VIRSKPSFVLTKADRERVKLASRELLKAVQERLALLDRFWEKEQTKGEIETLILDHVYSKLPTPPFTEEDKLLAAANLYSHVWQQAVNGSVAGFGGRHAVP
jgi:type I restriction enzyme R subunit